jgi:hypothetical protein
MVTCPWCGTNYVTFQSDCSKCGGPMPIPSESSTPRPEASQPAYSALVPPPPPRPIADRYVWQLLVTDGWAITSFVFGLLGAIFTLVGVGLTLGVITAFVGIPFACLGLLFLAGGAAVAAWRYQEAQKIVKVLQIGEAAEGQIVQVEENLHVRVNARHPWVIRYQFRVGGQTYEGQVSTLNAPGAVLQPGQRAYVLYLPQAPERNVLYPHP